MWKMWKIMTRVCAIALVLLGVSALAAEDGPRRVARVNDSVLDERDLSWELSKIVPIGSMHGGITDEKMAKYRPQATEAMIEKELFYQEALRIGMKPDKDAVAAAREATIERLGGKRRYKALLQEQHLSDRDYRRHLEKQYLVPLFILVQIEQKAEVSDEELRAAYEESKNRYRKPETRKLWHLLVSVNPDADRETVDEKYREARALRERAAQGEDLYQLAWDHSDGPFRVKGGDIGYIHRGRLDPGLEEAAFGVGEGELTSVVETSHGYHIIKVLEVQEERQMTFEEVSPKLREQLKTSRAEDLRVETLERLKADADIEVYE